MAMKIISGGRQSGRTTKLIQLCAEAESRGDRSYIVCSTRNEAYQIADMAKRLGFNIPFPISADEFVHRRYVGTNIDLFYIDNADSLLQYLSAVRIAAITIEDD